MGPPNPNGGWVGAFSRWEKHFALAVETRGLRAGASVAAAAPSEGFWLLSRRTERVTEYFPCTWRFGLMDGRTIRNLAQRASNCQKLGFQKRRIARVIS
jgi:hypothetical protein